MLQYIWRSEGSHVKLFHQSEKYSVILHYTASLAETSQTICYPVHVCVYLTGESPTGIMSEATSHGPQRDIGNWQIQSVTRTEKKLLMMWYEAKARRTLQHLGHQRHLTGRGKSPADSYLGTEEIKL